MKSVATVRHWFRFAGCIFLLAAGAIPALVAEPGPATPADQARIDQLILQLGSESYTERIAAQTELTKIGWATLPALRAARKQEDLEIAKRATQLVEDMVRQIETRREELRSAAQVAVQKEDVPTAKQRYLELLALPDQELRDPRAAIRLFEPHEAWSALAVAYQAAAEAMWRVSQMPPEAFIRPAPATPPVQVNDPIRFERGGPFLQVQVTLDGEWNNARGTPDNWIETIRRKQKDLIHERVGLLDKLGGLCMDRLDSPQQAVAAYQAVGRGVPLYSTPLDSLIPQLWPKRIADPQELLALDDSGAANIRTDMLGRFADAQVAAGDLAGACETSTRAMLGVLMADGGDWNGHYPAMAAERFWQIVKRWPTDKPLPPMLWLYVLDKDTPEIDFSKPEDEPHKLPISFPGPRLVVRPGHVAKTLTVSADMETPGGCGGVRCYSMNGSEVVDIGWVQWHADNRKGREWRTASFPLPKKAGIIRLEVTPYNGTEYHVRELKVKADFGS